MAEKTKGLTMDAAQLMDKQYRYQRYVYDWSRKYYLLGRDRILEHADFQPHERLLEVGCGTARNLLQLHKQQPQLELYGLDASQAMLDIAQHKLDKRLKQQSGTKTVIQLHQGLAGEVQYQDFGLTEPFDHILFSYVLSMIPSWPDALQQALENLKPGGYLHIVDFSDQMGMPTVFRRMLLGWLHLFHVHPDPEVPIELLNLEQRGLGTLALQHLPGRYALLAHFRKKNP